MLKRILVLLLLIAVGQIVALVFWYAFDSFGTNLFPPMAVSSVFVWLLYLNQNKKDDDQKSKSEQTDKNKD